MSVPSSCLARHQAICLMSRLWVAIPLSSPTIPPLEGRQEYQDVLISAGLGRHAYSPLLPQAGYTVFLSVRAVTLLLLAVTLSIDVVSDTACCPCRRCRSTAGSGEAWAPPPTATAQSRAATGTASTDRTASRATSSGSATRRLPSRRRRACGRRLTCDPPAGGSTDLQVEIAAVCSPGPRHCWQLVHIWVKLSAGVS